MIIITLDTVRMDHLSLYDYFRPTTPFLSRLGAESVVFNNAYTPIPHTVPAHTSLFTSHYPSEHKALYNGWKLKDWNRPLLAEVLKQEGYQTGAVIASMVLTHWCNLNRGFEFYQDQDFEHQVSMMKKKKKKKVNPDFNQRRAGEVVKWAEKWLNEIDRERAFFLWLHFYDAHRPYDPDPNYPAPFQLDPEFTKYLEQNHYLIPAKYGEVNTYDNQLAYLDQNLEKFFQFLKDRGLLDQTLIIITADHGEGLGQHKLMSHGLYLYEDQVRIPLLIRFPDLAQAGTRIDARVNLIDLAPTILDFLQIPPRRNRMEARGQSLLSLISGGKKELRPCEYFERRWYEPKRRVKGRKAGALCGEWKIIWADEEENELYHLPGDPFELTNARDLEKKKFLELETEMKGYLDRVKFFSVQKQTVPKEIQDQLKALGYTGK